MPANLLSTAADPTLYWEPGDKKALQTAMAYHDARHRSYRKAASLMGISLGASQLTSSKLDRDWFSRHALIHLALKQIFPAPVRQVIEELADTAGEKDPNFSDWQRRHALIHARLDTAFGIV